jgi:hypothetical protein
VARDGGWERTLVGSHGAVGDDVAIEALWEYGTRDERIRVTSWRWGVGCIGWMFGQGKHVYVLCVKSGTEGRYVGSAGRNVF